MDKLVKDLLNLSRLETGSFKLEQTVFDFTALAEEARLVLPKPLPIRASLPIGSCQLR